MKPKLKDPTWGEYHRESLKYGLPHNGHVDAYVKLQERLRREAVIEAERLRELLAEAEHFLRLYAGEDCGGGAAYNHNDSTGA